MLESPAYRALSLSAHRVLARLEIELAHHGGTDNGKLPVTFDNFHNYGIHRHAIRPAIRECEALGFVEVTEAGRAGNAEWRSPNKFRLTYRHTEKGQPTDEWRKIETDEQAQALANRARNTFSNAGKRRRSMTETGTENKRGPMSKTVTTPSSAETITTFDISGRGPSQAEQSVTITPQLVGLMKRKDAQAKRAPRAP